jgi:EAL domain-containing protein (putative c-di-GMP-specific phosphodiesterase class I)/FixJ family two-component response regulator
MGNISNVYSLSKSLSTVKQTITPKIILLNVYEIEHVINDNQSNVILFNLKDTDHDNIVFQKIKKSLPKTNLVCIHEGLNLDDKYHLLNKGIRYLSKKKFTEISANEFAKWIQHDNFKILIVEKTVVESLEYEKHFSKIGFKVKTISTDIDILESIKYYQPDLLLVDTDLNEIAGDELVKLVKKSPENLSLPIVFLSEKISQKSQEDIVNVGASTILTKPIKKELLVSTIIECIQVNLFHKLEIQSIIEIPQDNYHKIDDLEHQYLHDFILNNSTNKSASIIWLSISNSKSIQKKCGLSGYNKLCSEVLSLLPIDSVNFSSIRDIAEGVFVFSSVDLSREEAKSWVEKTQQWLSNNHFLINKNEINVTFKSIILSEIPKKSNIELLLYDAERLLVDDSKEASVITFLSEGDEQKHYYLIKTKLENAIRESNFKWLYQSIISTQDETKEIFQLLLRVNSSNGKELKTKDYIKVANQAGILKVLDRYTLKHAIEMIKQGDNINILRHVLINQLIGDFESISYRKKILSYIENSDLPKNRLVFQFRQEMVKNHTSLLHELGKELNKANIIICLSEFDASSAAWSIAKAMNAKWLRVKPFDLHSDSMHKQKPEYIGNVIKKAQSLGFKVMVPNVDSAGLIANIWALHADFIQGNFIQKPVNDLKYIEN